MMTSLLNHRIGRLIAAACVGCLVAGLAPVEARTGEAGTASNSVLDASRLRSPRINLEFGYFTARRQTFRELYGSYFNYALSYQRPIGSRFDLSLRAEFIRLAENGPELKYWVGSLTPMLLYNLTPKSVFHPVVGAGVGLSHRRVIMIQSRLDPYGYPNSELTITQKDWNTYTVLTAGFDIHASDLLVLGARTYFDYYPFGDPSVGDFGDTGGFHFVGRLGFKL